MAHIVIVVLASFAAGSLFPGVVALPLLGSPQGLVDYQNDVRVNDIFADTVNWDLLPDILVDRVSLVGGANPGYGLNALGGPTWGWYNYDP